MTTNIASNIHHQHDEQQSLEEAVTDTDSYHSSLSIGGSSSFSRLSSKWQEPIVVGYAFGPKKMSTMGVVMAEASRVKVIHEEPEEEEEESEEDEKLDAKASKAFNEHHCKHVPRALTSDALQGLEMEDSTPQSNLYKNALSPLGTTVITLENSNESSDLRHIVRYFRSNCSSAAGSLATMSETSESTAPISLNNSSSSNRRRRKTRFPILISFVPLDPDQPLEDQHGGTFDLILHKLTEDILSCSLQGYSNENRNSKDPSWKRVQALQDYHQRNSHCCLVDNPMNVQTVMSRSDIANVLQRCLKSVHTTSGIPVRSPKFVVIPESDDSYNKTQELKISLQEKEMSTPLIVKPLIAAGTKQSHCMIVALQESAFVKLPPRSIVQEFVNHNTNLYKVYVLGEFVSVYERHSLPNLPEDLSTATVDMVNFDSQRPYPKLKDFGLHTTDACSTSLNSIHKDGTAVTVEEVMPVANALKRAFGLELFGFDILKRSADEEWLVVDVNYFPSYKEVPNFPFILARYLTRRVLEQRRKEEEINNIESMAEHSLQFEKCNDELKHILKVSSLKVYLD